jgi:hypothetical protein
MVFCLFYAQLAALVNDLISIDMVFCLFYAQLAALVNDLISMESEH